MTRLPGLDGQTPEFEPAGAPQSLAAYVELFAFSAVATRASSAQRDS